MSDTDLHPMTEETLQQHLETKGARVMTRSGRSEHYGSPREFSFEVKAIFANGLGLHILARQYGYRDPWESEGRVNDMVDISLLRDGGFAQLPKGFPFFQSRDTEESVDWQTFCDIATCVAGINSKIFLLQELTGDL